jgi:ribonuclease-3
MEMCADLDGLTHSLGHCFGNEELLIRALTHKSKVFEKVGPAGDPSCDNEQLEFLGDAILGFLVSEELVRRHPHLPEGQLSKLKAHLVSAQHLYTVAQDLSIGLHIILGRGEEMSGGREKKAILSDAIEALIAAMFLDGGIDVTRRFVLRRVIDGHGPVEADSSLPLSDYKSALQEIAQTLKLPQPRYVIVQERGPEHAKTFTMEVRIGKDQLASAEGVSKKEAGQRAAEIMVRRLTMQPVV